MPAGRKHQSTDSSNMVDRYRPKADSFESSALGQIRLMQTRRGLKLLCYLTGRMEKEPLSMGTWRLKVKT